MKLIMENWKRFLVEAEVEDKWDLLFQKYYSCLNKKRRGGSPQWTLRTVRKNIERAKKMENGYESLVKYINKKHPGCLAS